MEMTFPYIRLKHEDLNGARFSCIMLVTLQPVICSWILSVDAQIASRKNFACKILQILRTRYSINAISLGISRVLRDGCAEDEKILIFVLQSASQSSEAGRWIL